MATKSSTVTVRRPRSLPGSTRWMAGLLIVTLAAAAVAAAVLYPGSRPPRAAGPLATHTIGSGELIISVTEQGTLESSNNTEIKCKVRGDNTIIWVIENGTEVQPGDELVRLDTLLIEEEISERTKFAHLARATAERSKADMLRAELAISEYLEGRFVTELASLEKDLAVAESKLRTTTNMLDHAVMMSESGYVNELEVEEKQFAVTQADLDVQLTQTRIDVLKRFTKAEELATLRGNLNAARAGYEADRERAYADEQRLKRAEEEFQHCVVRAERSGVVIYPSAAKWEDAPDIEEGATVHKDQVLLLMPDLNRMQVKVGIHESVIDRVRAGMAAAVTLPEKSMKGRVSTVAPVAQPAGWWTGNVVKYDTIVELPVVEGLKPGMTAEVEVILARYEDVLIIPAAAVVETGSGYACWIVTESGIERRALELGDGNELHLVVKAGVREGDQVVLDPLAYIPEAQHEAARTIRGTRQFETEL